jgi:hypothetical protein
MKKLIIGLLSIIFIGQIAVAQPVSDHAVIPVAITVQSVLRLNVRSGGNIEFVFTTINQITNGIPTGAAYTTVFDIASSINWDLDISTDAGTFINDNGVPLALTSVNLIVTGAGLGNNTTTAFVAATQLPAIITEMLSYDGSGNNIGNAALNSFNLGWACGTNPSTTIAGTPPGRYTVNVLLSLRAAN